MAGPPARRIWPIVYLDALVIKVRDQGVVGNKSAYLAMGVDLDGKKQILGLWLEANEGAKFWLKVSVAAMFEGTRIKKTEGPSRSEQVVVLVGSADDWVYDAAVDAQGTPQTRCVAQDGACRSPDERVVGGRRCVEGRMFEQECALEGDEARDGDVECDYFMRDDHAAELVASHRFLPAGAALGFGVCAKTSRKSFSSRRASSRSAATVRSSSPRFIRTR